MNDSPGWAAPGPSSPEPDPAAAAPAEKGAGTEAEKAQGTPGDDTEHTTSQATPQSSPSEPTNQRPPNWAPEQPPAAPHSWTWGSQGGTPATGQGPQAGHGQPRGHGWGPTPPPPGGPGWHQPGWHPGWAQQPQAPKPGVVPLRPLGVGEVLDGSVSTMRAHWRTVLGISLAVAVITEVVAALVMGLWLNNTSELDALANNDNPSLDDLNNAFSGVLSSLAVVAVVGMLGSVIATAMLTVVVSRAVLGRSVTLSEAWRDSRPQLLRLLGLLVLIPLLVSAAMLVCLLPGLLASFAGVSSLAIILLFFGFLGGIVAAVWMWVRFCLAPPALMLEKQGLIAAMRRSGKLVSGSWWRILGIQLLAFVLVTAISFVISIPATALSALVSGGATLTDTAAATGWTALIINGIGSVVASTLSLPLNAGITALLYLDQRIRREALDLELARAAGVPGYERRDTEPPAPGS
ncbi:hypothetical protein [Streptomyces sp. PU-14G]|uniref:hypothetical protein n=1 Tax=Streptomyces sp. PU-14G TaxID=2800808 RepID=UPI0034DEB171